MKQTTRKTALFVSAAILAATMGCGTMTQKEAAAPKKETVGEVIDDSVITTKVKAALVAEPTTKASQINVETFKGTVQLSGFVEDKAMADKAVELAKSVKGVASVKNDMRIR